ncbi:MAG: hypothetical protein GZ085_03750 [Sulfuriferula multivorans]|uniref:Uncharacterized protein n=1 Tax=Sulfuriferula multivorans TaxID=1559896 RepID=A0A7C9NSA0_9PROT|nr:hypothetical protein [Sulfuriferula multivorans]
MSFMLSTSLAIRLRDDIRKTPLLENEIRRIQGMGGHYIALESADVSEHEFALLFRLSIDEVQYSVYYKTQAQV